MALSPTALALRFIVRLDFDSASSGPQDFRHFMREREGGNKARRVESGI
jgi:hypothetical protein